MAILAFATFVFYQSCTKDPCKDVVCQHSGTCASGTCSCPVGYEGKFCDTLSRAKLLKVWTVNQNSCVTATPFPSWQVVAAAGTSDATFTLSNFSHATCPTGTIIVNCTMTGKNTFTIDAQTVCGIQFSGTGNFTSSTQMTVSYTYNDTTGSIGSGSCTETYN